MQQYAVPNMQKKYAQYASWTYEIYMHNKCKYAKICKKYMHVCKKKPCISMQTICTNMQNHMYVCVCVQCMFEYVMVKNLQTYTYAQICINMHKYALAKQSMTRCIYMHLYAFICSYIQNIFA